MTGVHKAPSQGILLAILRPTVGHCVGHVATAADAHTLLEARGAVSASRSTLSDQVAELRPALLTYARRAVRDAAAAEDLVQETIAAAMSAATTFEGRSKLRTWLTGILAHKCADYFRARVRTFGVIDHEAEVDLAPPAAAPNPETHTARRQALQALSNALATLPELERLAVLSVDVEGIAHDEVCSALSVSAVHLRVLLHRGRHKLRKAVEHAVL